MRRLHVLTNSSMSQAKRCLREYFYAECGYFHNGSAIPLVAGGATHDGLDHLFVNGWCIQPERLNQILDATNLSWHDKAKVEAALRAYQIRWGTTLEDWELIASEAEFSMPLINPDTGKASKTFVVMGKLDKVMLHKPTQAKWVWEHKTSSEDFSPGSNYWKKLTLNSQVSTYYPGARSLGHEPQGFVYDVIGKPTIKPKLETPLSERKYTLSGVLIKNHRTADEEPTEYINRLIEWYAEHLEEKFARAEVVRLTDEEESEARNMWAYSRIIANCMRERFWPQNPDACERYHRMCEYWPVCAGHADIKDPLCYTHGTPHRELSIGNNG